MELNDVFALLTTCIVGLTLTIICIVLLCGKGAMLIAGFNTMPEKERKKYDAKALCRFVGGMLLPVGLTVPAFFLGGYYGLPWLIYSVVGLDVFLLVFMLIYANTGNRFKKMPSEENSAEHPELRLSDGAADAKDEEAEDNNVTHDDVNLPDDK